MLGLIKKDILIIKGNSKLFISSLIIYTFFAINGTMDLAFIFPFMTVMIFISTFNYDDFNNWNAYAVTLPNGRKNVVKSKYIATISLTLIAALVGLVLSFIVSIVMNKPEFTSNISTIAGSLVAMVFMISVLYPAIFKYGSEKGRIVLFIVAAILAASASLLGGLFDMKELEPFIKFLDSYGLILVIAVSIIVLLISYKISEKIYLKKEF